MSMRWSEQRIEHDLRAFLGGRSEWPRYSEFVAAGCGGPRTAITHHGGARAWARRIGVR